MRNLIHTVIVLLLLTGNAKAYSVLTHEAIIDVNWDSVIVPLLRQKYPAVTAKELEEAHAFAYGGAIAPDMGYYPFGNELFSDLIHYVRTGDFVVALQEDATNVKEYAFALGVLSHYNADKYGHSIGVNPSVPLVFPKLREEYKGPVTYEKEPTAHIRTEFGFDVLQTARGNYVPDAYQRFISFEIADSLLRRSFKRNYNLEIDSIFTNYPRSVRTFRWAVKDIFPQLTRSAWKAKRKTIQEQHQTTTARNFRYRMKRATFVKTYGAEVERAGFGARMLAGLIHILPKVGTLKPLKVIIPGPEAEKLFIQSFDTVVRRYRMALQQLRAGGSLPNVDFDTGQPTALGEYKLADDTYYNLLMKLKERQYSQVDKSLKTHILRFYADKRLPKAGPVDEKQWAEIQEALAGLKKAPSLPE